MEEHPVLRRPLFLLHPCQTGTIMDMVQQKDDDDLTPARWLGVDYSLKLRPEVVSDDSTRTTREAPQQTSDDEIGTSSDNYAGALRYLLIWLCVAGHRFKLGPCPQTWQKGFTF